MHHLSIEVWVTPFGHLGQLLAPSNLPPAVELDYSLRSPFGPTCGCSTRYALLSRLRGNDGEVDGDDE